jgi:chromosome transmission fidelity protein 1
MESDSELSLSSLVLAPEFDFPYPKPYPEQQRLMEGLYEELVGEREMAKIHLVESPTGTGKTLSLLCALLTFFKSDQSKDETKQEKPKEEPEDLFALFQANIERMEKKADAKKETEFKKRHDEEK